MRWFEGRAGVVLAFLMGIIIATAGTATAAKLITGRQIKDGTITKKDLSKAVQQQLAKSGRGAVGPQGPKGDAGAPGATGAQGATGATGPTGISEYQYIEVIHNVNPGDTNVIASASCPAGKKLLGGGFVLQDSKFHVTYANTQVNDVYALTAVLLPGQTITSSSQAFVKAICAKVG